MSLAGVLEPCRHFDAAVLALEMALRVVQRSEDAPAGKLERSIVLLEAARIELCAYVRAAKNALELTRAAARSVDEVREAAERLAVVQLVLAQRMGTMTMAERLRRKLVAGVISADDADVWGWHCIGLVACELPVEAWTDSLRIPAETPAVEA